MCYQYNSYRTNTITKRIRELPDWSYYKYLYKNPNAKTGEKLRAMKRYLKNKKNIKSFF